MTEKLNIVSNDKRDNFIGKGARLIRITGNTPKGVVTEMLELKGLRPVTTEHAFIGQPKIQVTTSGNDREPNYGDIKITGLKSKSLKAIIKKGFGQWLGIKYD